VDVSGRFPAEDPLADYDPGTSAGGSPAPGAGLDAADPGAEDPADPAGEAVSPGADAESWDGAAPRPSRTPVPRAPTAKARSASTGQPAGADAAKAAERSGPSGGSSDEPGGENSDGDGDGPGARAPEMPGRVTLNPIEMAAELNVLATLFASPQAFDDVSEQLVAEDFGGPAHQLLYGAIVACDSSGRPFDPVTVADELSRAGTLSAAGGLDFVRRVAGTTPPYEHVAAFVDIVRDRALRRRMVNASRIIGRSALDPTVDAAEALDSAEQQVFDLGQGRSGSSLAPMTEIIAKVNAEMAKARTSKIVGRPTGIEELDRITGGLQAGQLIIIAARPGMGKSVLALQLAMHISAADDVVVPFYSYEMTHAELGLRILSSSTGVPMSDLRRGVLPHGDGMDQVVAREMAKLSQLRLMIDDRPPTTISGIRSAARRLARRGPLGAIVVDYVQLLYGDGGRRDENRTQEVAGISRSLKLLAGELGVPVVIASQLNRGLESRPNRRPQLSDLRESGALEQDANLVLALHREWVYDKTADETEAELLVLKNRQGAQAQIPLDWDGPCVRFKNTNRVLNPGGAAGGASGGFSRPGSSGGGGFRAGGFGGGASVVSVDPF
jgi:replicative DNA helicase